MNRTPEHQELGKNASQERIGINRQKPELYHLLAQSSASETTAKVISTEK